MYVVVSLGFWRSKRYISWVYLIRQCAGRPVGSAQFISQCANHRNRLFLLKIYLALFQQCQQSYQQEGA